MKYPSNLQTINFNLKKERLMQQIIIFKPLAYGIFAGVLLITSSAIYAKSQWCTGTISNVWINKGGSIFIHGTWRNGHTQICNLNKAWKGISPVTCSSWQALTQQAHATQKKVILQYSNLSSCKAIPTYGGSPSPNYVMLRK